MARRSMGRAVRCAMAWLAAVPLAVPTAGAVDRLTDLSLEDLTTLEITSVSKRAERLSDAPTSVFVITASDIRRSGAATLPEVLRLAPNLNVVQFSSYNYVVSARGFLSASANKLLVLIDGRSVYSPNFSGVFWEVQDLMLEDVERIEVISGPGATLWGVNAVNGVINVITRSATVTKGGLVTAAAGNQEGRASVRFGAETVNGLSYRVYATHLDRKRTQTEAGAGINDAARHTQAGFRADWAEARDRITLQGDTYNGRREQPPPGAAPLPGVLEPLGAIGSSGANLLGVWRRSLGGDGLLTVQAYFDHTRQTVPPLYVDDQQTLDLLAQHAPGAWGAHQPVWGVEYRRGRNDRANSVYIGYLPESLKATWLSLFAQDEITLTSGLKLTLGVRAERNDYSGTEFLPTARLAWKPTASHLLWAAASRAVRAPARVDRDIYLLSPPLRGGTGFRAETADDIELGYRGQPMANGTLSVTWFHTRYDHLRTRETAPSGTSLFFGNGMRGTTKGLEVWGSYQALPGWRLHAGFSRLRQHMELKPGFNDARSASELEGTNPALVWTLRSSLEVGPRGEFDLNLRHVSALPFYNVPRYTALDLRYGWHPRPDIDLSITGRNVLGDGHAEFDRAATRSHLKPAVLVKLEFRF